jgi:hypothetical protein
MSILSTGAPRYGRIAVAEQRSGLKRGSLYKLAAMHRGLFKKFGAATLVDLPMLDDVLAALPPADLKEPHDPHHENQEGTTA